MTPLGFITLQIPLLSYPLLGEISEYFSTPNSQTCFLPEKSKVDVKAKPKESILDLVIDSKYFNCYILTLIFSLQTTVKARREGT